MRMLLNTKDMYGQGLAIMTGTDDDMGESFFEVRIAEDPKYSTISVVSRLEGKEAEEAIDRIESALNVERASRR